MKGGGIAWVLLIVFLVSCTTTIVEEVVEEPVQKEDTKETKPVEDKEEPVIEKQPDGETKEEPTNEPSEPDAELPTPEYLPPPLTPEDVEEVLVTAEEERPKDIKLSVIMTPRGGKDYLDPEEPYKIVRKMGMHINQEIFLWKELQPSPNFVNFELIDQRMQWNRDRDLRVALIIRFTTDDGELGPFPGNTYYDSFADDNFQRRTATLVQDILARHGDIIDYVFIGYETDKYLRKPPHNKFQHLDNFLEFLLTINQIIEDKPIGTIISFDESQSDNRLDIVKNLADVVDVMGYTYFSEGGKMINFAPDRITVDFNQMDDLAGGTPFVIAATGFSVEPKYGGSEEQQEEWAATVLKQYAARDDKILYMAWYSLFDDLNAPEQLNRAKGLISLNGERYRAAYNLWQGT